MKTLLTILVAAAILFPLTANAIDVSGDQWGTWTKENSPYNVVGEIRVPPGSTLVIEPGVFVNFQGHYKFIVDSLATLLAVGTEDDSIYFTTDYPATGWHGVRFQHADSNSQISYCRLEYGKATGSGYDACGGGICCSNSGPTISHNTISQNSAESRGGGLALFQSAATVRNNRIVGNCADTLSGGGIYVCYDGSKIVNNTITANSAYSSGGGVYCTWCFGTVIRGNTITQNSAYDYGGAICCYSSFENVIIDSNIISANYAYYEGGGIFCGNNSCPTITRNTICGNSADSIGGAICCTHWLAHPTISNNTISRNSACVAGGGVYCHHSFIEPVARITNSILWGDTAPSGPEIYVRDREPEVAYSNVQGGWPGTGNIDADPIFVGPYNDDFHLRWRSPCIDAGDPEFPLDPDGTRSDIGAFYFDQGLSAVVEIYPQADSAIVIPPEGGYIFYDGWVFNLLNAGAYFDIWSYAFVPDMGQYGPIHLYPNIYIGASDSVGLNDLRTKVPGAAPAGDYTFVAYVGFYASTIIDSSHLYFTKTGSVGDGIAGWFEGDEWFKGISSMERNLPSDYALSQNYPNPFNATTVIDYQLPVGGYVKLEVYNLFGQKVATLVDSKEHSGYRSAVWDASEVSSGLYFYKLTTGGFTETRRMILVR